MLIQSTQSAKASIDVAILKIFNAAVQLSISGDSPMASQTVVKLLGEEANAAPTKHQLEAITLGAMVLVFAYQDLGIEAKVHTSYGTNPASQIIPNAEQLSQAFADKTLDQVAKLLADKIDANKNWHIKVQSIFKPSV